MIANIHVKIIVNCQFSIVNCVRHAVGLVEGLPVHADQCHRHRLGFLALVDLETVFIRSRLIQENEQVALAVGRVLPAVRVRRGGSCRL